MIVKCGDHAHWSSVGHSLARQDSEGHQAVEVAGEAALDAPTDLAGGLAFGGAAVGVRMVRAWDALGTPMAG
jgi:hypothetical protein